MPRFRLDLARCLREAGSLLATVDRHDEAALRLRKSQTLLSQLVKTEPSNEKYASESQLTSDELTRVTASNEKTILEEAEPAK